MSSCRCSLENLKLFPIVNGQICQSQMWKSLVNLTSSLLQLLLPQCCSLALPRDQSAPLLLLPSAQSQTAKRPSEATLKRAVRTGQEREMEREQRPLALRCWAEVGTGSRWFFGFGVWLLVFRGLDWLVSWFSFSFFGGEGWEGQMVF